MRYDLDDPRLTAFALGELDDEAERAAVEAQLAGDEASRRVVEEVRAAARWLEEGLRAEAGPPLGPAQRRAIESRLAPRPRVPLYAYGLAASLLLATGLLALQAALKNRPRGEARRGEELAARLKEEPSRGTVGWEFMPPPAPGGAVEELAKQTDLNATVAPAPTALGLQPAQPSMAGAAIAPAPDPAPAPSGGSGRGYAHGGYGSLPRLAKPAAGGEDRLADLAERTDRFAADAAGVEFERARPKAANGSSQSDGDGVVTVDAPEALFYTDASMPSGDLAHQRQEGAPGQQIAQGGAGKGQAAAGGLEGNTFGRAARGGRPRALASAPAPPAPGAVPAPAGPDAGLPPVAAVSVPEPQVRMRSEGYARQSKAKAKEAGAEAHFRGIYNLETAQAAAPARAPEVVAESKRKLAELQATRAKDRDLARRERLEEAEKHVAEALAQEVQLRRADAEANREAFQPIVENDFVRVLDESRSTFSIDVDTASYAIVRRSIYDQGILPPRDAVRIEELVNYFKYDYPQPEGDDPFSVNVEVARCPWDADHRLARIGLKGRAMPEAAAKKGSNIVFLVDVSGSMNEPDKLPLLQAGLRMLARNLGGDDRVAMVVYAGSEGLALGSTSGDRKDAILGAIDRLQAGGSTNGGAGIQLAYKVAQERFIPGGVNRVILCTDGDFNVGVTDDGSLQALIAEKAKSNVFLTVLGFGRGNLQDAKMEGLADKGNGNYHYIDSPKEAHKVLVEEAGGNLVTIAKDVKIQVHFNPNKVGAYRLLGYENRRMANQDFRDDAKDAGEIGAGHTVTALYELVPPEKLAPPDPADRPEFVRRAEPADPGAKESFVVYLRFKQPEGERGEERRYPVTDDGRDYAAASADFKFAAAVTSFGLVLRDSKYKGTATLDAALELAEASKGSDPGEYRKEFLEIIRKAKAIGSRQ